MNQSNIRIAIRIYQLLLLLSFVKANLLSPTDLVVGKWNIHLSRRDRFLFETMIFPPCVNADEWFKIDPNWKHFYLGSKYDNNEVHRNKRAYNGFVNRFQSLNCELILNNDGSFQLKPPQMKPGKTNVQYQALESLRGWWSLRPNPYCVTDRQYDELTLISYPKMRIFGAKKDFKTGELLNSLLTQKEEVTVELSCKIWGRYGSNSIRRVMKSNQGRSAGRISHGIMNIAKYVAIIDHKNMNDRLEKKCRVLCATFCGTAK